MPIPIPSLDNLSFDDLVAEGKRIIPGLAPSWTDHNPSDPGITFIELFAFVAEMLMFRANNLSDADKRVFVKLLRGGQLDWPPQGYTEKALDEEIRLAVLRQRSEERAVTATEYCRHALAFADASAGFAPGSVRRAHCLPRFPWTDVASQANVTVLVVPNVSDAEVPLLLEKVRADLQHRSPLTTRLHVALPAFVPITVQLDVYVFSDQIAATLEAIIQDRLRQFFDKVSGGNENGGWPFGQAVYVSDLFAIVDGLPGVDYVTAPNGQAPIATTDHSGSRRIEIDDGHGGRALVGIGLGLNELVAFLPDASIINIRRQTTPLSGE